MSEPERGSRRGYWRDRRQRGEKRDYQERSYRSRGRHHRDLGTRRHAPVPRPIGDKCNPLCPFFRCVKNYLRVSKEQYKGKIIRVPFCTWIGDKCIGAQCRFASCERHAMLPDGRCMFALKKRETRDFEEDLRDLEEEEKKYGFREDFF